MPPSRRPQRERLEAGMGRGARENVQDVESGDFRNLPGAPKHQEGGTRRRGGGGRERQDERDGSGDGREGKGRRSHTGWFFVALVIAASGTPVSSQDWFSTTLAGSTSGLTNGARLAAQFKGPVAVAVSKDKARVFVCDTGNQMIRAVSLADGSVSTIAGQGTVIGKWIDGDGTNAAFNYPSGLDVEPTGGLYAVVADAFNHRIRKVLLDSPFKVTTIAGASEYADGTYKGGFKDGADTVALFNSPRDVVMQSDGQAVYLVDTGNNRIRKVTFGTVNADGDDIIGPNMVTTIAGQPVPGLVDGTGTVAQFNQPIALTLTPDGQNIVVVDQWNHCLRKVSMSGTVTTVAGGSVRGGFLDGVGKAALFNLPHGITRLDLDKYMVCDRNNQAIRLFDINSGAVSTVAGQVQSQGYLDGKGTRSKFSSPTGLAAVDSGTVAVADYWNQVVRLESTCIKAQKVPNAEFNGRIAPYNGEQCAGACIDGFYPTKEGLCNPCNNLAPNSYYSGPGLMGSNATWSDCPTACLGGYYPRWNATLWLDQCIKCSEARCSLAGTYRGACLGGDGACVPCTQRPPNSVYVSAGSPYNTDSCEWVCEAGWTRQGETCQDGTTWYTSHLAGSNVAPGNTEGAGTSAELSAPRGLSGVQEGTYIYFTDADNHAVKRLTLATGRVDLIAGGYAPGFREGKQSQGVMLDTPVGIVASGTMIYVSEIGSSLIRSVDVSTGDAVVKRVAGVLNSAGYKDGARLEALFNFPQGLALSTDASLIYVADSANNKVRVVDLTTGLVSTLAGGDLLGGHEDGVASRAKFLLPTGLSLHPSGALLAVADRQNHKIRLVALPSGITSTLCGLGTGGYKDGGSAYAQFDGPTHLSYSPAGDTIFVTDYFNTRVRRVFADTGYVVTVAARGPPVPGLSGTIELPGAFQVYGLAVVSNKTLVVSDGVQALWSIQLCENSNASLCGVGAWRGMCPVNFVSESRSAPAAVACIGCTLKPPNSSYISPGGPSYGVSSDTCEWVCDQPFYRRRDDLSKEDTVVPDGVPPGGATSTDPGGIVLTTSYDTSPDYQIDFWVNPSELQPDWRYLVFVRATNSECCQYPDRIPLIAFNPGETTLRVTVGSFNSGDMVCPGRSQVSLALNQWSSVRVTVQGGRASTVINGVLDARCSIGTRFKHTFVTVVLGQRYSRFEKTSPLRASIRNLTYTHLACSSCPVTPCPSGQYRSKCLGELNGGCLPCTPPPQGFFFTGSGVPFDADNCTLKRCNTTACQKGEYQRPCSTYQDALCRKCVNPLAVFAYFSGTGDAASGECPWLCCCGYVPDYKAGLCVLPNLVRLTPAPTPGPASSGPVRESFTLVYAVQYSRSEFLNVRSEFLAAIGAAAAVVMTDVQLMSIIERDAPSTTKAAGKKRRGLVPRQTAAGESWQGGHVQRDATQTAAGARRQDTLVWLDVAVKLLGDAGTIGGIKARVTEAAVNVELTKRGLKIVYFQSVSEVLGGEASSVGAAGGPMTIARPVSGGGGIDPAVAGGVGGGIGAAFVLLAAYGAYRRMRVLLRLQPQDHDKEDGDDVLLAIVEGGDKDKKDRRHDRDEAALPSAKEALFSISISPGGSPSPSAHTEGGGVDFMALLRVPGRTQSLPDEDMHRVFAVNESIFGGEAAEPAWVSRRHSIFTFAPLPLPTPPMTPRAKPPPPPRVEVIAVAPEVDEEAQMIERMSTRARAPPMNIFGGKGKRPRRGSLLEKFNDGESAGQTAGQTRLRRRSSIMRDGRAAAAAAASKVGRQPEPPQMKKSILGVGGQTDGEVSTHANWTEILFPEEVVGGAIGITEKAAVNFGWENGQIKHNLLRSTSKRTVPPPPKKGLIKMFG